MKFMKNDKSRDIKDLPISFRQVEVRKIFNLLNAGDSCQIIGIGSVGKSNLLRFLQQEGVRRAKLGTEWDKYLLVHIDANKLLERSEWGLWELMLHQILVEFSNSGIKQAEYQEIDDLHQRATAPATRHIALRYLDRAIGLICKNLNLKFVFLFDEFDDLYQTLPSQAFDALRALRDENKYSLMYVIATRRELSQLRSEEDHCEAFEELVTPNTIWLAAYSKADARYTLQRLASRHSVKLSEKQIQNILKVTGGHPGLIRAVFPLMRERSNVTESLLTDKNVREECQRIWQSLAKDEQKALALLVSNSRIKMTEKTFGQLQQKGLLGGEWAESEEVFSTLFSIYIRDEKPVNDNRIKIDHQQHMIWVDDREIQNISGLEYKLLEYLEERRGQVCTREQIAQYLYPNDKPTGISDNAIDSIIKRLRKQIEPNPKKPTFISTVHGVGFRLIDGETTKESQGSKT
jgi:DNA-binding winged helix-turn-helix (wHTH) protein